jgi:signal transduction histidine kinase
MVNRTGHDKTRSIRTRATLLFLLLAVGLEALIAFYWFHVLEPQLTEKAKITARAVAQSGINSLADALTLVNEGDPSRAKKEMARAVDKVLLLSDPYAGRPFINKIEVVVDYDAVNAPVGSLDIVAGGGGNGDSFETEMPIYSRASRELLGIARLHNSREVYRYFKKDVQRSFLAGAVIVLLFLLVVWWIVTALLQRIRRTEEVLREKQALIVHSGRLTAMGEMATGIAHELNQPLAIIRVAADGLMEYFSKENREAEEAREARKIVSQVSRAAAIIDNMRSFARNGVIKTDAIDLRIPIEKALSFFREQFRIHGIRLDLDLPEDPVMVRIDSGKFQQIIVNLLSNARHAVEEEKKVPVSGKAKRISVRLTTRGSSDTAILEVGDNGIGMSPEVQERCMEPFFTTKSVGDGTGLGLSIARGIAKEFGMTLDVRSVEGEGSVFQVHMKRESGG